MNNEELIWNTPMVQLMLMLRQHIYVNDRQHSGMSLKVIDEIDNGEIDRKLREKRENKINNIIVKR